jgi:hypothetical protein
MSSLSFLFLPDFCKFHDSFFLSLSLSLSTGCAVTVGSLIAGCYYSFMKGNTAMSQVREREREGKKERGKGKERKKECVSEREREKVIRSNSSGEGGGG